MTGSPETSEPVAAHPKGRDATARPRAEAGSPERWAARERQRADGPGAKALRWVVFDLDGTLVDSDRALIEPYLRLGFTMDDVRLGPLLVDECARLGIEVDDYLAHYDSNDVTVFPGVEEVLARLPRWAVASNKIRASGEAELARFGWSPACALFAEDFGGRGKHLGPVLDALGVTAAEIVFVGDTDHDREAARDAGATFALAGWNPRTEPQPGDVVLTTPAELTDLWVGLLAG